MLNIVNLFSKAFALQNVQSTKAVASKTNNPFGNPFVNTGISSRNASDNYAKNSPVKGGYFAGYYNNRPNIVGQRLFVEA